MVGASFYLGLLECSLADLRLMVKRPREHPGSVCAFSLGMYSADACGLASKLIEFIQV